MKNLARTLWEKMSLTNFLKWGSFTIGTSLLFLGISFVFFLFLKEPSQIADTEELYAIVVLTTAFLLSFGAFFVTFSRYIYWRTKAKELGTSLDLTRFILGGRH